MNLRKKLIISTFTMLFIALTGCGMQDVDNLEQKEIKTQNGVEINENSNEILEKTDLRVPISYVKSKNPYMVKDKSLIYFNKLIFQGLCEYNGDFDLENKLAKSVEKSEDGKKITIKLKSNVKWHDGSNLNADDVVFSYNLMRSQYQKSGYKDLFEAVFDTSVSLTSKFRIQKINNQEIVMIFDKNYVNADYLLTLPIVNRRTTLNGLRNQNSSYSKIMTNDYEFKVNGTGPYKLEEHKVLKEYSIIAFEDYFEGIPQIRNIKGIIVSAKDAFLTSVLSGITDLAVTDELDWGKYVENKRLKLYDYSGTSIDLIFYNYKNSILKSDIGNTIRLAIANAIDREDIVRKSFLSHGVSAHTLRHPKLESEGQSFLYDQYDLSNFDQVMIENGYNLGDDGYYSKGSRVLKFNMIALKDDIRLKEIEIIQKNLKAIGILINVNLYDDMELFQEALVTQKFDMAIATVNMPISDYYDDLVKTRGALNFGGYSNSDIDTRLNELKNLNGQEIKQRTEELLKLITHEQVVTPIAYRDRVILVDDRIGGSIDPNMFDIYEKIITWNIGLE